MAQARYPAIDEFRGMYNGRSIFDEFETSEESGAVGEILFNSEEAKISPTMEEIKTVGEAVRGFERELAADLRAAIASLRRKGETVVCVLPGHESQVDEFHCDRELFRAAGQWVVQAI